MSYNNQTPDTDGQLTWNLYNNGTGLEDRTDEGTTVGSGGWNFLPFLIPVVLFAVVGNLVVVYVVLLVRRFRRPANFMLANLSLACVLKMAALVSVDLRKQHPLQTYGPWFCRIIPVARIVGAPAESFSIMCISLQRTQAVARPMEREGGASILKKIGLIWLLALALELPQVLVWKYDENEPGYRKCLNGKEILGEATAYTVYVVIHFVVISVLPPVFMLRELIHLAGLLRFLAGTRESELTEYQACQRKLIRNAVLFTLIFLHLRLPAGVIFLILRMPADVFPQVVSDWASEWKFLAYHVAVLNSSIYPAVIFILSMEVRSHCRSNLRCHLAAGDAG